MSQPDAPATIGAAIRAARLAKGLSQSEVTAQMSPPLPYTCISRWERGAVPSLANLAALAAVLGPLDLPAPGGGVIRVVPPGAEATPLRQGDTIAPGDEIRWSKGIGFTIARGGGEPAAVVHSLSAFSIEALASVQGPSAEKG